MTRKRSNYTVGRDASFVVNRRTRRVRRPRPSLDLIPARTMALGVFALVLLLALAIPQTRKALQIVARLMWTHATISRAAVARFDAVQHAAQVWVADTVVHLKSSLGVHFRTAVRYLLLTPLVPYTCLCLRARKANDGLALGIAGALGNRLLHDCPSSNVLQAAWLMCLMCMVALMMWSAMEISRCILYGPRPARGLALFYFSIAIGRTATPYCCDFVERYVMAVTDYR